MVIMVGSPAVVSGTVSKSTGEQKTKGVPLVDAQLSELDSRESEIESLKLLILKLKRMQFGPRSEKFSSDVRPAGPRPRSIREDRSGARRFRCFPFRFTDPVPRRCSLSTDSRMPHAARPEPARPNPKCLPASGIGHREKQKTFVCRFPYPT